MTHLTAILRLTVPEGRRIALAEVAGLPVALPGLPARRAVGLAAALGGGS